jgi:hypothetical protein
MNRTQAITLCTIVTSAFATACSKGPIGGSTVTQSGATQSKFQNGNVCGKVQARPDHELAEMPITLTAGGETRFVNLEGTAFDRLLKFVTAGEKTICLNADWADVELPTLENFVLVSVPDFHGPENGRPAGEQVKDGDYRIAQCVSKNPDLGGHSTLNLVASVKNNVITTLKGPALEFAPELSATYRGASSLANNQGEDIVEIQVSNGTIQMNQPRTIESITLNLSAQSVSVIFTVPGRDDVHSDSIRPINCSFGNLELFKKLSAAE